jgi:hypothetical protein
MADKKDIVSVKVSGPRLDKPGRWFVENSETATWLIEKDSELFMSEEDYRGF